MVLIVLNGIKISSKFEKGNDSNNHAFFANLCTNLRYRILKLDKKKIKLIAGKIIPAIQSTTAIVTGFVFTQLYSLINSENIPLIKNICFNRVENFY